MGIKERVTARVVDLFSHSERPLQNRLALPDLFKMMRARIWQRAKSPVFAVVFGGIVALCLSTYPVIFLGKSFVSPGYGPGLLYDRLPLVPDYHSTETEELSADHGAMPWQNLPYSRVQSESIFAYGEFPIWNRYNSGGVPLFGQGQSQILDPIHWIAVAGQGNNWAWDLKLLASKLVFLIGLGAVFYCFPVTG